MPETTSPVVLSRRNFTLGVINGVLFFAFNAFIDVDIVLPGFAWKLTGGKPLWVGALVAFINSGWFWPQLFLAPLYATQRRMLPWYWASAFARVAALTLAAAVAWHLGAQSPTFTLVCLTLCYALYTSSGGLSMIPFITLVRESVPPHWRGRFFGLRYLFGGLLAFGAGFVVKYMLSDRSGYPFPQNYAVLFTLGAIIAFPSVFSFCLVKEGERETQRRYLPVLTTLQRGVRLTRRDRNFRRLLVTRGLWSLALGLTIPFIVPYALSELQVTTAAVGLFLGAKVLTYSLSNLLWSRVSDQQGNRQLLVLSSLVNLLALLLLLGVRFLPNTYCLTITGLPLTCRATMLCLIFACIGFGQSGQEIGYTNFLLELLEERKRSVYLGFFYLFLAPLCWVPVVGALLIGSHGHFLLGFHLSALLTLGMVFYTFRLKEVREINLPHLRET